MGACVEECGAAAAAAVRGGGARRAFGALGWLWETVSVSRCLSENEHGNCNDAVFTVTRPHFTAEITLFCSDYLCPHTFRAGKAHPSSSYRNRQQWLSSPSTTLSGSGSWDLRAHQLATRAWRTTWSGHIPNKSSPFAKVRPERVRLREPDLPDEHGLETSMIVKGKAGPPSRTRTYVGQAGTGSKPAEPSV